jgi:vesicle-associated membrane protein 7
MENYQNMENSNNKILECKQKLDETKTILGDNIEKVIERGEKIELIVDKTHKLQINSKKFRTSTRNLKRNMCIRKYKLYFFIFTIFSFFVVIISSVICGIKFDKC